MSSNQNRPEIIPKIGGNHSQAIVWRFNRELYRFMGGRCRECGKKHFPMRFNCGYCGSTDLEEVPLTPMGKVLFGEFGVNGTASGYEDAEPNLFVTVELEDGFLVDGAVVDVPLEIARKEVGYPTGWEFWDGLKGKRARMVFRRYRKLDNGNLSYGYRFKIIDPPWGVEAGTTT